MSDLIERLRRDGYTIGGWDDALLELEAQQAEIARLRAALGIIKPEPTRTGVYDDRMYVFEILSELGLIREPTRLERFWATRDTKDVYGPPSKAFQLIEEALNFEK